MAATEHYEPAMPLSLERTRYFTRQLVGPAELTGDQNYIRDRQRRHNRLLHGWGIVCGGCVRKGKGDSEVVVEPVFVFDPCGNEIAIDQEVTVDLSREDIDGNAVLTCGDVDPWCSDVRVERGGGQPLYLAVRYSEYPTRPVRVLTSCCGCDDAECEYSRIRDGYALKALTTLPATYADFTPPDIADAYICPPGSTGRACPPRRAEPWVILADVRFEGGVVSAIDCYAHRRYVVSFAESFFVCSPPSPPPSELDTLLLDPDSVTGGQTSEGTVGLSALAPAGGASVVLTSTNPALASVPATVDIPAGDTTATFDVTTTAVGATTPVDISASYGGATRTSTLTVEAVQAGFAVMTVRVLDLDANVLEEEGTPFEPISVSAGARPNALEVEFSAPIDFESVVVGTTFAVTADDGTPSTGDASREAENRVRVSLVDVREQSYTVQLVGGGSSGIRSLDGIPLEGDVVFTLLITPG